MKDLKPNHLHIEDGQDFHKLRCLKCKDIFEYAKLTDNKACQCGNIFIEVNTMKNSDKIIHIKHQTNDFEEFND